MSRDFFFLKGKIWEAEWEKNESSHFHFYIQIDLHGMWDKDILYPSAAAFTLHVQPNQHAKHDLAYGKDPSPNNSNVYTV